MCVEGREVGRRVHLMWAHREQNPEKARAGLAPRKIRPFFPGTLQDPAQFILPQRTGSRNNLGGVHPT